MMQVIAILILVLFCYVTPIWLYYKHEIDIQRLGCGTNALPTWSFYSIAILFMSIPILKVSVLFQIILGIVMIVELYLMTKVTDYAYKVAKREREKTEEKMSN